MRKTIFLLTLLMSTLLFFSCKKECECPKYGSPITVTYEVITSDGKSWYGAYSDDEGKGISISEDSPFPNGFETTIVPKYFPFIMSLTAYAKMPPNDTNYPKITINFYVNGALSKSVTTENAPKADLNYIVF